MSFYIDEQKMAKIIGVGCSQLEPLSVRGGIIVDRENVEMALSTAIDQATENFEDDIRNAVFGVNNDLSIELMTTAKSSLGRHGPIQKSDLDLIDQTILENALINARNEILENTGNAEADIDLVTSSNMHTKVNGKPTKDPMTLEGDTLEMAKFTAFTPSHHVKTLQKLAKRSGLNIAAVGSELFSFVNALNNDPDYIIIDIESDFTKVGVIFGNGIVASKTLHVGADHFTKEISQKMGLSLKEAEKIKNSYIYGKLAQSETLLVQNSIHDTLNIWLDGIQLLFTEFSGVKTFASKIYLVGEGSKIPDLFEFISSEPWTKSIPFKAPPEFEKVRLENFAKIVDSTGEADTPDLIMPASLASIYLEILHI